jgi:glycosyltransferase involved in cell wall biosynthesis
LVGKKGHKYLIDACAQLADKGHKFHCSIVGNGPLHNTLQAHINECGLQDCVSLLGAKTQAEINNLYRDSDIFALPCVVTEQGDRDGMPNVLLEAMAMQLPVVTTPVTGIPELVVDGENGFLVSEQAVDALTRAIEQLINDKALRRVLGQHGRQTVLAGFDIHQTAAQLATILQGIHNRSRTA